MLTAYVQSFDLADRIAVRHAMTFLVGLAGVAALLPIGRLAVGRWAGLTAIALCLMTGYFYGSLFFTPIDVPFLAAMTWATLRHPGDDAGGAAVLAATVVVGSADRLAIATRTGGIITHAYLLGAMVLVRRGSPRPTRPVDACLSRADRSPLRGRRCRRLDHRDRALAVAADRQSTASNSRSRLCTSPTMPMALNSPHWGERIWTNGLAPLLHSGSAPGPAAGGVPVPAGGCARSARLPPSLSLRAKRAATWRVDRNAGLRAVVLALARGAGMSCSYARPSYLPLAFLIVQRATVYDGMRHVLFVIPMLAILAGVGLRALLAAAASRARRRRGRRRRLCRQHRRHPGRVAPARICRDQRVRRRHPRRLRQVRARLLVRGGNRGLASARASSRLSFIRACGRGPAKYPDLLPVGRRSPPEASVGRCFPLRDIAGFIIAPETIAVRRE